MLDRRARARVEAGLRPLARGLRRVGLTADHLTVMGLVFAALAGYLVAVGRFGWAAVALVAGSIPDLLDGAVAKASGTAGPRGAFFDSVADRFADSFVLGGAAWWFADHEPRLAVLAMGVLALSLIISYERARADALGYDARGGLMERAERLVALVVALVFDILEPVLWVMLGLTTLTALQRFVKVWRQASAPAHDHVKPVRFRERPRVRRIAEWWSPRRGPRSRTSDRRWRRRSPSARRPGP